MQDFKRLDELAGKIAQRDYLIKKRKKLAEELATMSQDEIRLQSQSNKETHDYRLIEKLSIKKLLKMYAENYEEMMDQEYREMKIAQYKYEALIERINASQEEIKGISELLTHYDNIEKEYETLLNAKRLWANENGYSIVENFESQIRNMESRKKEVDEAINASRELILSLMSAKEDLSSAKNWEMFDKLGGDLIPRAVKHDYIKRASQYIKDSSEKARRLMRELEDLKPYFDINFLEINALTHTFDIFFDNVFSDFSIQHEIDAAYENISQNFDAAEALHGKLMELKKECDAKILEVTERRNQIILSL